MDVGTTNGWRLDDVVPAGEIVERISAAFPLEPVDPGYRGEVAKRWRYTDGGGEIGLISSVTQPFCGDCTRSRISAEGRLYTCLFGVRGHDLRALVRGGASDEELRDAIAGDLGQAHRPLLRAALRGDGLAAEGGDELHRWLGLTLSSRPRAAASFAAGSPRRTAGAFDDRPGRILDGITSRSRRSLRSFGAGRPGWSAGRRR